VEHTLRAGAACTGAQCFWVRRLNPKAMRPGVIFRLRHAVTKVLPLARLRKANRRPQQTST